MSKAKKSQSRAKPKLTLTWRGETFSSRKDLIDFAKSEVRAMLGKPVTERGGDMHAELHFVAKLTLAISDKPRRKLNVKPIAGPKRTAGEIEDIPTLESVEKKTKLPNPFE